MEKYIVEIVLNTLGIVIIWYLILKNRKFNSYSKEHFYTDIATIVALTLISIRF